MSINNNENISEVDQSRKNIISDAFFEQALSQFDYTINLLDRDSDDFHVIYGYLNLYSKKKGGPYPSLILAELFQLKKKLKTGKFTSFLFKSCMREMGICRLEKDPVDLFQANRAKLC